MKYTMQTVSKIIGECNEVYKRAIAENLKIWSNPDGSLKPDCCGYLKNFTQTREKIMQIE